MCISNTAGGMNPERKAVSTAPEAGRNLNCFPAPLKTGILNRVKTGNAVIPIDGQEHARTDGHYYMVEIYGYLVENGVYPELFYRVPSQFY